MSEAEKMSKEETEKEFSGKVAHIVDNGFTLLAMALGYKLKLFDLMGRITSDETHKTSQEIADAGGYRERYVREWLGAMVCSNIVECEPCGTKFWLPRHRLPALKSETESPLNVGAYLPMFGNVSEKIRECFKPDGPGGLSYDHFGEFHECMSSVSTIRNEKHLIKTFIGEVDGLREKLEAGIKCLDIGCGIGLPSKLMAETFPNSEFWGADFSAKAIQQAKDTATKEELTNVHYFELDCTVLKPEWTQKFDYVTAFDAIHDQARPDLCLKEIVRVLKPGGTFSMFDIKGTSNPFLDKEPGKNFGSMGYVFSLFHCMTVSLHYPGGLGVGAMWGSKVMQTMLKEAGFSKCYERDTYDPYNTHFICQV